MMIDIAEEIDNHLKDIAKLTAKHNVNKYNILSDLMTYMDNEELDLCIQKRKEFDVYIKRREFLEA